MVLVPLLLGAAFLAGWLPVTLELRRTNERLRAVELELRLANVQRRLGTAAAEARRNNFGIAATEAGQFFDETQRLLAQEPFTDQPRLRTALAAYAARRDTVMSGLATNDVTTATLLSELYLALDGVRDRGL
ncbi:MAG TPA: hypothetical protein VGF48_09790 [Thermoanaerobaculia bacterium]